MRRLFIPSILFMNRLKYGGKFVLVSGIFFDPTGYSRLWLFISSHSVDRKNENRSFSALALFPEIQSLYINYNAYVQHVVMTKRGNE